MAGRGVTYLVPRSVRVVSSPDDDAGLEGRILPLAAFRSDRSYILLGEPGQGKTEAFKEEAKQPGCIRVTARQFVRDPRGHPRWGDRTLFIDGLDEIRAGAGDPRTPLDEIIARLDVLGNPPFRLSCRVGSWFEPGDARELASSPGIGEFSGTEGSRVLELNPLSPDDVRQILRHRRDDSGEGVSDANQFIEEAFEHGLDAFLWNPELLRVLLSAVETAGWPDSPRAAFENACRDLAKERNTEHQDAWRAGIRPSLGKTLSAAGRLSALLLLTGKEGWTATDTDDPDVLSLRGVEEDIEEGDRDTLRFALESGLFSGTSDCRTPVHRLVAEFLGALHLDGRIRAPHGPGLHRVLSLLLGHDGIPLPDLRGLSAWLAALNPQARPTLIRVDPVAVAFDGDASSFGPRERRELFENLENSIELGRVWPSTVALGALAGPQGKSAIWELTASSVRSDARQQLVFLLLSGFSRMFHGGRAEGSVVAGAQSDADRVALLEIVRDATWWSDIRCRALVVLDQVLAGSPIRFSTLRGLVGDVEDKRLPDERNRLLGTLLDLLYPGDLLPAEVWDHLAVRPYTHRFDAYQEFWTGLVDNSSDAQIRELLDSLCSRGSEVIRRLANHRLDHIVLELLARALDLFGDKLGIAGIYRWFDLVEVDLERSRLVPADSGYHSLDGFNTEAEGAIITWLRSRPRVQYELVELGLHAQESEIGHEALNKTVGRKFPGEEVPAGFRHWCLVRAAELWDRRPKIAEELARWAIREREGWGPPLSDDEVMQAVRDSPPLREWNDKRLEARACWNRKDAERKKREAEILRPIRERQQAEVAAVREHATELANGRCRPELLHKLARIYVHGLTEEGPRQGPIMQLRWELDGDEALVEATLAGFRNLLNRDDQPDLVQIAQLHERSRQSYFALPFLAGMAEEERAGGDPLDRLGEKGRRRALGYYLVSRLPGKRYSPERGPVFQEDARPPWYLRALDSYPRAVADALVAVHNARVRMKNLPDQHLYDMSVDPMYMRVRALAVRRMFTVFPSRCSAPQVESLRLVLSAALGNGGMSTSELRDLVLRRLKRSGMDVAQRAQWLCAGLFIARQDCLPAFVDFLTGGGGARVRHVVGFFVSNERRRSPPFDDWQADELAVLIRTLGGRLRRTGPPEGGGFMGHDQVARMKFEPLLTSWIGALAGRGDDQAARALESLASDPGMGGWSAELARAREEQAAKRRVDKHEPPSLARIQETLQGGPPSSAADLAALVLDALDRLAQRIPDDSTNDWQQYWHLDPKLRRPLQPRHEDDCRNALLSDLCLMLQPYGVDAHKEGQYADDKRADIRAAFGSRLAIPVEIKKNSNRDVWRAPEEQLVAKYTRAPESAGYGIYLVFWFGPDHMKVVPPLGHLPKTPAELKERLEEQLAPGLRAKISIVVIDVSPSGMYAGDRAGGGLASEGEASQGPQPGPRHPADPRLLHQSQATDTKRTHLRRRQESARTRASSATRPRASATSIHPERRRPEPETPRHLQHSDGPGSGRSGDHRPRSGPGNPTIKGIIAT